MQNSEDFWRCKPFVAFFTQFCVRNVKLLVLRAIWEMQWRFHWCRQEKTEKKLAFFLFEEGKKLELMAKIFTLVPFKMLRIRKTSAYLNLRKCKGHFLSFRFSPKPYHMEKKMGVSNCQKDLDLTLFVTLLQKINVHMSNFHPMSLSNQHYTSVTYLFTHALNVSLCFSNKP